MAEFGGEDSGKHAVIVRTLYGLHGSGATFRNHLAKVMSDLGLQSCKADLDVWMWKTTKPDGSCYYEYILFYVDDALKVDKYFLMKPNSIAVPDIYLSDAKISKARLPNGTEAWAMSSSKYVQEAIKKNVKAWLEKRAEIAFTMFHSSPDFLYRPELDISSELDADDANYFISVIRVLCGLLILVMWKLLPKYSCYCLTLLCLVQDTLLAPSICLHIFKRNTMPE